MSKRSGPEGGRRPSGPERSQLLALAGAVADGSPLPEPDGEDDRVRRGLRVIAGLCGQLGAFTGRGQRRTLPPCLFQWGHLDVLECIGRGNTADVYRAFDPLLAVEVALKLSRPGQGWAGAGDWIAEARSLARIRHPNVVAVHGVDRHDGRTGLWLDLVEGESLDALGRRCGPLPVARVCETGVEICRGLAAIHDAGVLHCDLKPANLMRADDGRILITDFGAALNPGHGGGVQRGTPLATAPEVLEGAAGSVAGDLYSLGVVLYWLASGTLPVVADDMEQLLAAHRQRRGMDIRLSLADGPAGLADLLARLLHVDPRQRPASAAEVGRILAEVAMPTPVGATVQPAAGGRPGAGPARFERLVARDVELAYLRQEYQRATVGHALPVLLAGESGTGKSSVAAHLADWLRPRGGHLLRMTLAADPAGEGAAAQLKRMLAGWLNHRVPAADDPAEVIAMLRVATRPLVLCLDDLQHADATDRAWLRRLAAELRGQRVLLVGLIRTAEGQAPPVAGLFGDGPVGILRLAAFSRAQVAMAIDQLLGAPECRHDLPEAVCDALYRLTGGKPFFLVELLRHLIACGSLQLLPEVPTWHWRGMPGSLPSSLELAILERCAALPADGRRVLQAAAVLGEQFGVSRLARLLAQDEAAVADRLAAAAAHGIVELESERRWAFRHALIQQALYRSLDDDTRQQLHRQCVDILGDALEPPELAALSLHAERAGSRELAFTSGFGALQASGLERADPAQLQRLQDLLGTGIDVRSGRRWAIGLARVRALRNLGRLHAAQEAASQLEAVLQPREASRNEDLLRLEQAANAFALGEHRRVLLELAPILAGDRRRAPQVMLRRSARLLEVQAQAALGDYSSAERTLAGMLEAGDDRGCRSQVLALYGWCLALQDRFGEAAEVFERALRRRAGTHPAARADLLRRQHWVQLCRGRYQRAYHIALEAHDLYRGLGDAMGQAKARMGLAQVRLEQGLCDEAVGYLHRTLHDLDRVGDRHCHAETLWLLAAANTRLGQLALADGQLATALELILEIGDRDDEFRFLTGQARLRRAQQRPDLALECATRAAHIATGLGSPTGAALAQVEIAAAWLEQGQAQAAAEHSAAAATQLHALGSGECWRADWLHGRCRMALAQPEPARVALARAQQDIERIVAEFGRDEPARRQRLHQAWAPLVEDAALALAATAGDAAADRLRQRWARNAGIG